MCTALTYLDASSRAYVGRTLELELVMPYQVVAVPAGTPFRSQAPGKQPVEWTSSRTFIAFGAPEGPPAADGTPPPLLALDGANDVGLTVNVNAYPGATGDDAVWAALQTMDNFDVPPGIQRNVSALDKSESSESTLYIVIADTANMAYYMRTHVNNEVFKLDMKAQDPKGKKILQDNSPETPKRAVTEVSFG